MTDQTTMIETSRIWTWTNAGFGLIGYSIGHSDFDRWIVRPDSGCSIADYSIVDHWISDFGSGYLIGCCSGYRISYFDSGCWTAGFCSGCWIVDPDYSTADSGYSTADSGYSTADSGYWIADSGYWIADFDSDCLTGYYSGCSTFCFGSGYWIVD
jgi:hypothetical protein